MNLKYKILFYNIFMFLVFFDVLYIIFWVFSIQMNPLKAILVAVITTLLMPWIKASDPDSGRKVAIKIYAAIVYKRFVKQ